MAAAVAVDDQAVLASLDLNGNTGPDRALKSRVSATNGTDKAATNGVSCELKPGSKAEAKEANGTDANGERNKPKAWKEIWGSGQGIGSVDKVVPVAELVARFKKEYEAAADAPLA